jgi:hypothetical protein
MYTVWHVDKYKITFKLVINRWTNEILVTDICYTDVIQAFWVWAFRHIQEYYSLRNISTIKYLFMKNASKTKMTNSRRTSPGWYNWCQDPVPDRGRAVECGVHKSCFLYQPHSAPKSLSDCRFLIGDLNGSHLFVFITKQTSLIRSNTTQFILIHLVTLKYIYICICYMFRPVLRPSSGMSIQNPYKGIYGKNLRGPFSQSLFLSCQDIKYTENV